MKISKGDLALMRALEARGGTVTFSERQINSLCKRGLCYRTSKNGVLDGTGVSDMGREWLKIIDDQAAVRSQIRRRKP